MKISARKHRGNLWIGLGFILFLFLFSYNTLAASSTTVVFSFSQKDLRFSKWHRFDKVQFREGEITREPGKPQLPAVARRIILPSNAENISIEVTALDSTVLPGTFLILPAQKPRVLSARGPISWTPPDPETYASSHAYPHTLGRTEGAYSFFGTRFAEVVLYPLRFLPADQKLVLFTKLQVKVRYSEGRPSQQTGTVPATLPKDVLEDIRNFFGEKKSPIQTEILGERVTSQQSIPYLIITDSSFVKAFRPLAEWKTRKGLRTRILTTQAISEKYYGRDLAEKVRGCIGYYHQFHRTLWVLLGGDVRYVPLRYAWAMDCEAHYAPNENNIPADIYFSDLDGIWDANKNGIFGEVKDRINLYPDVFVGRFSASSPENVTTMVQKVLTYEKNPPMDYTTRMLFLAMVLWQNPYTDSGEGKNYIGSAFVPEQFKPITKLYESLGNENVAAATNAINSGYNIVNHDGHAWYNSLGMGEDYFGLWDADHLENGPRYSIFFSIGCWPGAFDKDCMAEHLTRNPNGGMVAFIGNSRYGWGSPGNPEFGYSDRFDQQFFRQIFKKKVSHIGEALALAKAALVPFARSANVYRWCEYEINLFGDPEMPVWTQRPRKLWVELPGKVLPDSSLITVTVRDSATGLPVSNARVCFDQPGHVYATGLTDETGQFAFFLKGATGDTTLWLTITAPNFLPYEKGCDVRMAGRFVRVVHAHIDDSAGNGDGIVNPGERVRLKGFLKNFGTETATNVQVVLSRNAFFRAFSDSVFTVPSIAPGDSVVFEGFSVGISPLAKDGDVVPFRLTLRGNGGETWQSIVPFVVGIPCIRITRYRVDDRAEGNGNFIPDFGEHFDFRVYLKNEGHGYARGLSVELVPDSLWLDLKQTHFSVSELAPGAKTAVETRAYINPSTTLPPVPRPLSAFPLLKVRAAYSDTSVEDSVHVSVGKVGFEYATGCAIPWEMGGKGDLWHLSTHRTHLDSVSWYCGDESSYRYKDNMNAYLRTIPFVADQKSELSFWAWYDVTVYGVDGFYVEVKSDTSNWRVLDFIGSGGALNPFLMGNGWLRYTYDLSSIPAGTPMQVQFRFVSDDKDEAEGVYIEHVEVKSQMETAVPAIQGRNDGVSLPKRFELEQNYPNPFNSSTVIEYALPERSGSGLFRIFNMLGEEVYARKMGPQAAGVHRLIWNGRDLQNRPVQTGLYFYQLHVGKFNAVKKLILLK